MIEIKIELYNSWVNELHELQETLNTTLKSIEGKKTDPITPIHYATLIGKEATLRKILSQIELSFSNADDIENN